jgi:hypothetical protein
MVSLRSPIDPASRRVLFRSVAAVLAHSGHEPLGLMGLEAMASGGVACTGCSGEDYAMPGENALVLETTAPGSLLACSGLYAPIRGRNMPCGRLGSIRPGATPGPRLCRRFCCGALHCWHRRRVLPAVAQCPYGRALPDAGP